MKKTIYTQNLHMHSVYCDGKDTPEQTIKKAIELGFDTIGFSGHSHTGLGICWDMSLENTQAYKEEVNLLKAKYKDRITVLCGLEHDVFFKCDTRDYDYVIGSSHFLDIGGKIIEFDESADVVADIIEQYFGGDGLKYAKSYYENMARLNEYADFDIVGHFDIISKHCEKRDFFDVNSREYQSIALEALHALAEKKRVFEVNTGAIARGYRTTPYPAPFILKELYKLGCTVILTSDCHDRHFLNHHYDRALEYIRSCGFKSIGIFKNGKIEEIAIV